MTGENLVDVVTGSLSDSKRIEIISDGFHKNGSGWAIDEVNNKGRRGFHFTPEGIEKQLPTIKQFINFPKPKVVSDYERLKILVDEHNKQYEEVAKQNLDIGGT